MSQRPETPSTEPTYPVQLLPDVRAAMEQYAREQKIPVPVAIAEACRSFAGLGE